MEKPISAAKRYVKLPHDLLTQPQYQDLSADAKIMYAHLANRTQLSASNDWYDAKGNCFVYCTIQETQRILGCGHGKATKVMRALEEHHLIERTAQGQGRPHRIVVMPCNSAAKTDDDSISRQPIVGNLEGPKRTISKTDIDRPIDNNTISMLLGDIMCRDTLRDLQSSKIDIIISVLADIICWPEDTITIGRLTVNRDDIANRIWVLDAQQIRCLYYDWVYRHPTATDPHDCILAYLASTI